MLLSLAAVSGCRHARVDASVDSRDAHYFNILENPLRIVSIPPDGGRPDTLRVDSPMGRLVCMSSSYIGFLDALGCDSVVCAVSGAGYISSPSIRMRDSLTMKGVCPNPLYDVGYEAALDYERILSLSPDLFITYAVGGGEPAYISKLKSLGVRVFTLHEHLEEHPLARASYIRLFGALTDRRQKADSIYERIAFRYDSIRSKVSRAGAPVAKALLNIPYADQWFIPGAENYMSHLVKDAGGEVLGAREGESASRVASLEECLVLSRDARFWLNPGGCTSRDELMKVNPSFSLFDIPLIYNNIARTTPQGGNDFWESGALRCDLVLEDLSRIFSGRDSLLYYYIKVQ